MPPNAAPIDQSFLDLTSRFKVVDLSDLYPSPHNARKHTKTQIRDLAKSIEAFGFLAPILTDKHGNILAGHARFSAAELLGLKQVPVIFQHHLTETQATAYALADNQFSERSTWDEPKLAVQLKGLMDLALEFDIEATGFDAPEIDFRIQSLEENVGDNDDNFEFSPGPAVSELGDVWFLGDHKIYCGDAREQASYVTLMADNKAAQSLPIRPTTSRSTDTSAAKGRSTIANF